MVYRVYVEKKPTLDNEARSLCSDIRSLLGIKGVERIRLINRYDVENIEKGLFEYCINTVFSEPQLDMATSELPEGGNRVFATEYLPGQFDQRADSAAQCIQLISKADRPIVKTAKVYIIYGDITDGELDAIKKYVINPVESREAELCEYESIKSEYAIPEMVPVLEGFIDFSDEELDAFISAYGLAMDGGDIRFCRDYFKEEGRNPTLTEIRMIDTYWSDHCRHTTFNTRIDTVKFESPLLESAWNKYISLREGMGSKKPITLMDLATIAVKQLKREGKLTKLDESEEINACTVKIKVNVEGNEEDWLLLFKNETHNHPTEIEPFGGAATCIGGAIRDPLSGRSNVYGAMRVTGAADPTVPISETIEGKLPQRKICITAAAGYSSYGNQIGLATGQVDELYHPGYAAKRMEIGAVIAAAPAENVRRECPAPGDVVILLGGRTGRDGCGGATGSSKSHRVKSLEKCGAEVQKGNAPEERKLQRFFRRKDATLLIKRCNDFGAGGVSVAIGELADGLDINLNAVPKKYEGLDGTELAISESQERMAVAVEAKDAEKLMAIAAEENLEATKVADVTDKNRLTMPWNGNVICDISRDFLNSNGAPKNIDITTTTPDMFDKAIEESFAENINNLAKNLNVCSKRGLSERFDSTIGAGTVLMPFGGKYQLTPAQSMVQKISVEKKDTDTCSFMAYGFNPEISEKSPYHGAYLAVVESVSKLIASGADFTDVYLTFQEYFEKPMREPARWGKPLSALLGAMNAQLDLGIASIGGKDSMSGSFEQMNVPPTLVSFAVTTGKISEVVSPEFKLTENNVVLFKPEYDENGLPVAASLIEIFNRVSNLAKEGKIVAISTPTYGGIAESVMKMCFGNMVGFKFDDAVTLNDIFGYSYGSFVAEVIGELPEGATLLGKTTAAKAISFNGEAVCLKDLLATYEGKLEKVYPAYTKTDITTYEAFAYTAENRKAPSVLSAKPKVIIPVFPGTNCEYDSAKAVRTAGAEAEIFVIRNLTSDDVARSVDAFTKKINESQIVFIPGGFSGGDEPDGSGKFITAFFRNPSVKEAVENLLDNRDGLMCGICNGFQALIKLGLVPYGKIVDTTDSDPTLTFNTIGRHQSRLVRTRIASNKSPWLSLVNVGDIITVPISHGEGRFLADDATVAALAANGQIATQYVDFDGNPTSDILFNPNNSVAAIEGITSPDGRVFGKMGHSERIGSGLYKNVPGEFDIRMFESAVKYFKG